MITQFYAVVDVSGGAIGAAQDNGVDMQPDGGELEWTQIGSGDGFNVQESVGAVAYYEGNGSPSDSPLKLYCRRRYLQRRSGGRGPGGSGTPVD